jgi:hypothetical protein
MTVSGHLLTYIGTNVNSNDYQLAPRSSSNFALEYPVTAIKMISPYRAFEKNLSDNLFFAPARPTSGSSKGSTSSIMKKL